MDWDGESILQRFQDRWQVRHVPEQDNITDSLVALMDGKLIEIHDAGQLIQLVSNMTIQFPLISGEMPTSFIRPTKLPIFHFDIDWLIAQKLDKVLMENTYVSGG